jgi:hypothetical protein
MMKLFGKTARSSVSKIEVRLKKNLTEVLKDISIADEIYYAELSGLCSNAHAIAESLREDFTKYLNKPRPGNSWVSCRGAWTEEHTLRLRLLVC